MDLCNLLIMIREKDVEIKQMSYVMTCQRIMDNKAMD